MFISFWLKIYFAFSDRKEGKKGGNSILFSRSFSSRERISTTKSISKSVIFFFSPSRGSENINTRGFAGKVAIYFSFANKLHCWTNEEKNPATYDKIIISKHSGIMYVILDKRMPLRVRKHKP